MKSDQSWSHRCDVGDQHGRNRVRRPLDASAMCIKTRAH